MMRYVFGEKWASKRVEINEHEGTGIYLLQQKSRPCPATSKSSTKTEGYYEGTYGSREG